MNNSATLFALRQAGCIEFARKNTYIQFWDPRSEKGAFGPVVLRVGKKDGRNVSWGEWEAVEKLDVSVGPVEPRVEVFENYARLGNFGDTDLQIVPLWWRGGLPVEHTLTRHRRNDDSLMARIRQLNQTGYKMTRGAKQFHQALSMYAR